MAWDQQDSSDRDIGGGDMRPKIPLKLAKRFRRVCPEWAGFIMSSKFNPMGAFMFEDKNGSQWNIRRSFCCIVGEAHKRKAYRGIDQPEYGCQICGIFSQDLMDVYESDWPDRLRRFLDHYEKEHPLVVAT